MTPEKLAALTTRHTVPILESYAVVPADPEAATLLVLRPDDESGAAVVRLAYGRQVRMLVPGCLCDDTDTDADDCASELEQALALLVGGFTEYRRHATRCMATGFAHATGSDASYDYEPTDLTTWEETYAAWPRRVGSSA